MTDANRDVSRRGFLRTAAGTATVAAGAAGASGTAMAQSSPYGGYLSNTSNFDGKPADKTGQDKVTIEVGAKGNNGNFAFSPPAVVIDPGTTVVWEWTGKGGSHNVVHEGGKFESKLTGEKGHTFKHKFESKGVFKYYCQPHKGLGMKGVIDVGGSGGGGGGGGGGSSGDGGGGSGGGTSGPPDFGGWLGDVGNYDGNVKDLTGKKEVTVEVGAKGNGGNFAFAPPAIHVDSGTTVVWEWTGEGGSHNVVHTDGAFKSKLKAQGTFKHTFKKDGIYNYYCAPHRANGMKGSVVVGTDYPTKGGAGASTPIKPAHMGVPFQAHFVGIATILAIAISLVFTFFLLKYGESAHTSGGNN